VIIERLHHAIDAGEQVGVALDGLAGEREQARKEIADLFGRGAELQVGLHPFERGRAQAPEHAGGRATQQRLLGVGGGDPLQQCREGGAVERKLLFAGLEAAQQGVEAVQQLFLLAELVDQQFEQPERSLEHFAQQRAEHGPTERTQHIVVAVEVEQVPERFGNAHEVAVLAHAVAEAI